jgi:DNA-binding beta-propeller fold protein YncE
MFDRWGERARYFAATMNTLPRFTLRFALVAAVFLAVVSAASQSVNAGGTPECPQIITCVEGNTFTEPGDVDCNGSLALTDFALLVQAPFCDACRTCMSKDVNGDSLVTVADVTAWLDSLLQTVPTPTATRTRSATATATASGAPGTATRTPSATVIGAPTGTATATGAPATTTRTPTLSATPTRSATTTVTRTPTQATATDYSFAYAFGTPGIVITPLSRPIGTAIDANDHIWIADARDRVVELDATGGYVRTIGASGSEPGYFKTPRGIAFDNNGNIYVADTGNNRIEKFASSGQFLLQFGASAALAASEDLSMPTCVAVRTGVVFVCDTNHHNIKRFNTSGIFQGQWGTNGDGPGEFDNPVDIAFDFEGFAYVADLGNDRVQKFDASFQHVLDIGTSGEPNTLLDAPTAVAVGPDDRLYVSDFGDTIKVYATDGSFVGASGETGSAPGQFDDPRDVALDGDGNVYVADTNNNRLQKLDPDLQPVWAITDALRERLVSPVSIAQSPELGILVSDTVADQARVVFFSPNGEFEGDIRIGTGGDPGLAHAGSGIAIAPNGDFYLTDSANHSVVKFSAARVLIKFFGTPGTGPGEFMDPRGIAVDEIGTVFVVDGDNNRVQKFDSNGVFLDIWGGFGTAAGQFNAPQGIAVYGDRVYVTDSGNDRVQVFNRSGDFLTQWGDTGTGSLQFMTPRGIAVDGDGYVYVLDSGNHRAQKFTPDGAFIVSIGNTAPGRFFNSIGIAIAGNGDVLAVNATEKRVVVWQTPQ